MVDALQAIETVRAELERAQREIERLTAERRAAVAQYEEELNMGRLRQRRLERLATAARRVVDNYLTNADATWSAVVEMSRALEGEHDN
jgi:hypothetical protein